VPEQLLSVFGHAVPPFHNVALASAEAAIASIDDREFLYERVRDICTARDALYDQLRSVPGCQPLKSVTNFILIKTPLTDARPLVQAIADRGVLIRGYGDPILQSYIRVSVGLTDENQAFLTALEDSLREMSA
jgi:histidinol-phosphate aminotransferase